jgi:hypothetical protein
VRETKFDDLVYLAEAVALTAGLGYAAYADWRSREVSDRLWLLMALVGSFLAILGATPNGVRSMLLFALVAALVLEHLVPWDVPVEKLHPDLPGILELVVYVGVLLVLLAVGWAPGIGPEGLPLGVIAVYVTVLLARGLFEVGLLYGGADAKALMVAGLLIPIGSTTLVSLPLSASAPLAVFPFSLTVLMNSALFAIVVPLWLLVRNVRRGEFELGRGFTGFRIDVEELPHHFVWIRDPTFPSSLTDEEKEVETAEEDQSLRERQRSELRAAGVARIWVTPQIPFVILLAAGAIAGLLLGNLLYDLFAVL